MLPGDKYQVFVSGSDGHSALVGTFDTWREAKAERGSAFDHSTVVRAAWIMRINPSLNLRPEKFGFTLRRTKHEAMA